MQIEMHTQILRIRLRMMKLYMFNIKFIHYLTMGRDKTMCLQMMNINDL